jgi:hypothetical protein
MQYIDIKNNNFNKLFLYLMVGSCFLAKIELNFPLSEKWPSGRILARSLFSKTGHFVVVAMKVPDFHHPGCQDPIEKAVRLKQVSI